MSAFLWSIAFNTADNKSSLNTFCLTLLFLLDTWNSVDLKQKRTKIKSLDPLSHHSSLVYPSSIKMEGWGKSESGGGTGEGTEGNISLSFLVAVLSFTSFYSSMLIILLLLFWNPCILYISLFLNFYWILKLFLNLFQHVTM